MVTLVTNCFQLIILEKNIYEDTKNHRKQVPDVPYRSHYNKFKMAATAEIFRIIFKKKTRGKSSQFYVFCKYSNAFRVENIVYGVIFWLKGHLRGQI